jgi:hypothetical protein
LGEAPNEQTISLPPALQMELAAAQAAWLARNNTRRLWSKDATLWTGADEASWLGWLDVIDSELSTLAPLQDFAQDTRAEIHRRAAARHGRLEPRPRGAGDKLGLGTRLSRASCARLHRSRAGAAFRSERRHRAHSLHRRQQIGQYARAERADGLFSRTRIRCSRERGRHPFRRHYRSGLAAAKDRRGQRLSPRLPRHSQHRRALFRSVEIRPGPAGGDWASRCRLPKRCRRDGAGVRPGQRASRQSWCGARDRHGRPGQ